MAVNTSWSTPIRTAPEQVARAGWFPPRELASFAAVGMVCTLLFALAYDAARTWLPPLAANCLALTATAGLNFAANRWLTFRGRGAGLLHDAWQYTVCYVAGLGASSLALALLLEVHASPSFELFAALAASGLATVIRYLSLSLWVYREQGPRVTVHAR